LRLALAKHNTLRQHFLPPIKYLLCPLTTVQFKKPFKDTFPNPIID
jgi:hypothetical protein